MIYSRIDAQTDDGALLYCELISLAFGSGYLKNTYSRMDAQTDGQRSRAKLKTHLFAFGSGRLKSDIFTHRRTNGRTTEPCLTKGSAFLPSAQVGLKVIYSRIDAQTDGRRSRA